MSLTLFHRPNGNFFETSELTVSFKRSKLPFLWKKLHLIVCSFKRTTVFCLGHRLSKHKITKYARHLGGYGSLGPPGYAYDSMQFSDLSLIAVVLGNVVRNTLHAMKWYSDK